MTERARRPTIKEVAQLAQVSPMTVSRTLSGGVNVRPDVQEKVFAAVEELGYYRNENARSIRPGHTSGLIGVAITNIANPYYSTFALGVEEQAALTGRRMLLGNTSEDAGREAALIDDFLGRRVEGLVVVPTGSEDASLTRATRQGVPVVLASRRIEGLDVDSVVLDDAGGAHAGTTALIEAGHTHIGFLGNSRSIFTGARRHDGFARALADHHLSPDLVRAGQQTADEATAAMRDLLALETPPTAVFCANNRNSIGALREIGRQLRAGGVSRDQLPELMSFDSFELAELSPVPLSIIDHDPQELGRAATKLLLARLHPDTRDAPVQEIELPVELKLRAL